MNTTPDVRAAGGVVWRRSNLRDTGVDGGDLQVLLVHRPKYDDWTIPKGKAERDETDEHTALREVREETGLLCTLGAELAGSAYVDHLGRPKTVRYWAMTADDPEGIAAFEPNDEVDELAWFELPAAREKLSYDRDVAVLDSLQGRCAPA